MIKRLYKGNRDPESYLPKNKSWSTEGFDLESIFSKVFIQSGVEETFFEIELDFNHFLMTMLYAHNPWDYVYSKRCEICYRTPKGIYAQLDLTGILNCISTFVEVAESIPNPILMVNSELRQNHQWLYPASRIDYFRKCYCRIVLDNIISHICSVQERPVYIVEDVPAITEMSFHSREE